MNDGTLRATVLKTAAELERVRPFWKSSSGNRDSEMESYLTLLRTHKATLRPHVIVVEREGHPEAILVGRIDRAHIGCRLGYWQIKIPAKLLIFVYGAFRGGESLEACNLMTTCVLQSLSQGEADAAYMNFLRDDSLLYGCSSALPGALCRDYLHVTQQHYTATLPTSVEAFYRNLSPKVRQTLRRQTRKLDEHFRGEVIIRCLQEESNVDELATEAERIAGKSYQRGLGVGFVDSAIVREQLRLKAQNGWLRGYVLYLGGIPSAFWIGDINCGTFGSDYLGYDPAFGRHSPGTYLILRVIEGFCQERPGGIESIDFGPGHSQYKEIFSTQKWTETAIYIFAPTVRGFGLNVLKTCSSGIDRLVKTALVRAGLLQKIKKAWRTRVTPQTAL